MPQLSCFHILFDASSNPPVTSCVSTANSSNCTYQTTALNSHSEAQELLILVLLNSWNNIAVKSYGFSKNSALLKSPCDSPYLLFPPILLFSHFSGSVIILSTTFIVYNLIMFFIPREGLSF